MIEHHGKAAFRPNPANLNATGVTGMIGKKYLHSRGLMITVAVIALMTLTAGVAAAASLKAENIEVGGFVTGLALPVGSTVVSEFKFDSSTGLVESVRIRTKGETVDGIFAGVTACQPAGSDACIQAATLLTGGTVKSVHSSTARLTVVGTTLVIAGVDGLIGFLQGSLHTALEFTPVSGDVLSGMGTLNISSPAGVPSVYACVGATGVPVDVSVCVASKGRNVVGQDPVMVPVVLDVVDSGSFRITSPKAKLRGDIEVIVTSTGTSTISITNARVVITDAP